MPLCQFPKLTFVSFIARHSEREKEGEIRQQIVVVVSAAAGTAKKGSAGGQGDVGRLPLLHALEQVRGRQQINFTEKWQRRRQ